MLAIIGFIALIGMGLYFLVVGLILTFASTAFRGGLCKETLIGIFFLVLSAADFYVAYENSPFSVVLQA